MQFRLTRIRIVLVWIDWIQILLVVIDSDPDPAS